MILRENETVESKYNSDEESVPPLEDCSDVEGEYQYPKEQMTFLVRRGFEYAS